MIGAAGPVRCVSDDMPSVFQLSACEHVWAALRPCAGPAAAQRPCKQMLSSSNTRRQGQYCTGLVVCVAGRGAGKVPWLLTGALLLLRVA